MSTSALSLSARQLPRQLDRRAMALLSTGHAGTDLCQGAVPALLPFLISERGYSIGAASALVLAVAIASSIVQPLFGHLSDRRSLSWLIAAGPATAGLGLALTGVVHSYAATFSMVVISGLGVAAYHPEGSRYANYVSGPRRATGMSLFSVGGNAGFALGPALVTPALLGLGLEGTLAVGAIPILVGLVLAFQLGYLEAFRPAGRSAPSQQVEAVDRWGPFARLTGVIAARSVVYFGLMTFVPLYFIRELGQSKGTAGSALTVMLAAGAAGTLIGGRLADRYGRRVVLLGAMGALAPLIVAFLASGTAVATALLVPIGACTIATFSVTVVLGQEYLPTRIGVASGVTLGLAIGLGGVAAALLGALADAEGIRTVIWLIAGMPLAALALTLGLPGAESGRRRSGADATIATQRARIADGARAMGGPPGADGAPAAEGASFCARS